MSTLTYPNEAEIQQLFDYFEAAFLLVHNNFHVTFHSVCTCFFHFLCAMAVNISCAERILTIEKNNATVISKVLDGAAKQHDRVQKLKRPCL